MEYKNLTPHSVVIYNADKTVRATIPPEKVAARVTAREVNPEAIGDFVVSEEVYGEVTGLPEPEEGVLYIVSGLIISACPDRTDLVRPSTSNAVRDEKGQILGVYGFVRPSPKKKDSPFRF